MTPVKQVALEHQLPVLQPERIIRVVQKWKLSCIPRCRWDCDRCFWTILQTKLLENLIAVNVTRLYCLNIEVGSHSLCPINGDEEAGVTIMEMVGNGCRRHLIAAHVSQFLDEDNVGTLFEKLALFLDVTYSRYFMTYLAGGGSSRSTRSSLVTFSAEYFTGREVLDWTKTNR